MTHLETELQILRDNIYELMNLVRGQLEKGQRALDTFDEELADEIIENEKRVDSLELAIERDCENLLALHHPVAVDLRFVIAVFKINSDLERIGDHADSIAKYILDFGHPIEENKKEKMRLPEMFDVSKQMLTNICESFSSENTQKARSVFKLDKTLNQINRELSDATSTLIDEDSDDISNLLYLFSIVRKLERVGDLTKNIAEEIIFYIEAKVLRHHNRNFEEGDNGNVKGQEQKEGE